MHVLHVVDTLDAHPGLFSVTLPGFLAALRNAGVTNAVVAGASHDELAPGRLAAEQIVTVDEDGQAEAIAQIAPLVRGADVVHIHAVMAHVARIAAASARSLRKPRLISPYGQLLTSLRGKSKLAIWLENRRFGKWFATATRIHCVSADEQRAIARRGIRNPCVVLPIGFDGDVAGAAEPDQPAGAMKLPWDEKRRVFAYFGDIDGRLGLVPFLKACDELEDELENWRIVAAGRPTNNWLETFQAGVRRHGKEDLGAFVVYPDAAQQAAVLAAADFVVQPSATPAPPISALWAMWHGKPVLVSNQVGLNDITAAGAGLVAEPSRKGVLPVLAEMLAKSREELSEMGQTAARLARERYSWSATLNGYKQLYEELVRVRT